MTDVFAGDAVIVRICAPITIAPQLYGVFARINLLAGPARNSMDIACNVMKATSRHGMTQATACQE